MQVFVDEESEPLYLSSHLIFIVSTGFGTLREVEGLAALLSIIRSAAASMQVNTRIVSLIQFSYSLLPGVTSAEGRSQRLQSDPGIHDTVIDMRYLLFYAK